MGVPHILQFLVDRRIALIPRRRYRCTSGALPTHRNGSLHLPATSETISYSATKHGSIAGTELSRGESPVWRHGRIVHPPCQFTWICMDDAFIYSLYRPYDLSVNLDLGLTPHLFVYQHLHDGCIRTIVRRFCCWCCDAYTICFVRRFSNVRLADVPRLRSRMGDYYLSYLHILDGSNTVALLQVWTSSQKPDEICNKRLIGQDTGNTLEIGS